MVVVVWGWWCCVCVCMCVGGTWSEQRPVGDGRIVEGYVQKAREDVDVHDRGEAQHEEVPGQDFVRVQQRVAVAVRRPEINS